MKFFINRDVFPVPNIGFIFSETYLHDTSEISLSNIGLNKDTLGVHRNTAFTISLGLTCISLFHPSLTVSTHSVLSRMVTHGIS